MGDQVAALDQVAVTDREVVQVAIEGREAVAVGDDRVVAVAGQAVENPDDPRVRGEDIRLVGSRDVVARVTKWS